MLLWFVLMRYKTWIEDRQKMTRKIKFDLQFFVPRRLRLMMVADTTPLNKDFSPPGNVNEGNTFSKACCYWWVLHVLILQWDELKKISWQPRVDRNAVREKWQELGLIEKLSRIEDDTTPLNLDRATPQDLYLPSHLWNMRTKTTHKQYIKQNKNTSHHRYYTYFFNIGGYPMGRLWMMKGHRIFEPGEIRISKKTRKQKPWE
jgi:hypothetical protein